MIERTFDRDFLNRLALAMAEVEHERSAPADSEDLDTEADEAIYLAYQENGGDPAAAKRQLTAARERCDQGFGRILQFISDQYGNGAIEQADDAALKELTRDGFDATENWDEHVGTHGSDGTPESPLRALLKAYLLLQETARDLHDALLWPLARRISPGD